VIGLLIGATVSFVGAAVEPSRPAGSDDSGCDDAWGSGGRRASSPAVGPLRDRRVRRRLRPAGADGLLVPPQFGVQPAALGALFFAANLLAAVSSLSAARSRPGSA
jgi:hypothetical protein